MKSPRLLDQPTRLTAKAKADIAWWRFFVAEWNGVGFFPLSEKSASLQVFSDASGSWGCGAFTETTPTLYFQFHWSSSWASAHIAAKELLPVVAGAALWGKQWENKLIVFRSDNSAAVEVLNNRSAADPTLTYLLQCLFFFEAYFQFDHVARHVSGRDNVAADALSRNRLPQYILKGVQRSNTLRGKQRLPITSSVMRSLRASWASGIDSEFETRLMWAASCLAFFGFLRSGELTLDSASAPPAICRSDVAVDSRSSPSVLSVHLRRAKTDPFGRGVTLFLGRSQSDVCPVAALLNYLAIRPAAEGPLFIHANGIPC